jgi:hypothetical protein
MEVVNESDLCGWRHVYTFLLRTSDIIHRSLYLIMFTQKLSQVKPGLLNRCSVTVTLDGLKTFPTASFVGHDKSLSAD